MVPLDNPILNHIDFWLSGRLEVQLGPGWLAECESTPGPLGEAAV